MGSGAGPKPVADGLLMQIDAGNPRSYSGSGITVNDLSYNNISASFSQFTYLSNSSVTTTSNASSNYTLEIDLGKNWTYQAEYQINSNNNFNTLVSYGNYTDGILLRSFRVDTFYVKGSNYYSYLDVLGTSNSAGSWIPLTLNCFDNNSNLYITVYRGTSLVASVTTTSGLNPGFKTFRVGQAIHASNEGLDGAVRNIVFTPTVYSSDNKGYFQFNGTSTVATTTIFTPNISNKSLLAWCKLNSTSQTGGGLITLEKTDGTVFDSIVYNENSNGWGFGSESYNRSGWSGISESSISQWVFICATYENNNYKLYRNGVQIYGTSTYNAYTFSFSSRVLIGKRHTGGSNPHLDASISHGKLYARALSSSEVMREFNAAKGRYGL